MQWKPSFAIIVVACACIGGLTALTYHVGSTAGAGSELRAQPLSCATQRASSIGAVARLRSPTTTEATRAGFVVKDMGTSDGLVALRPDDLDHAGAATSVFASTGAVLSLSNDPTLRSCHYLVADQVADIELRTVALDAFVSQHLVDAQAPNGHARIWRVTDDPTSTRDVLVVLQEETPLTSASPGTITTFVAIVDRATGHISGASVVPW